MMVRGMAAWVWCVMMVVVVSTQRITAAPSTTNLETHAETENEILDDQYFEDLLHKQREALKRLECRPMEMKLSVRSQLKYHDALADKMFFPEVISIPRCDDDCSFCGNHKLGLNHGTCKPETERMRPVAVFYVEKGQKKFRRVMVKEHVTCKCA